MADWNPENYLRHADERSRPFADLLARVPGSPGARARSSTSAAAPAT